jgi:hypothetical protein
MSGAEVFHQQLAGAVYAGFQQVAADAGIVPPAAGEVHVQIRGTVLHGDVAGEVGNLHLFPKGFVHILLGGGVQEAESGLTDGSDAGYLPGDNVLFTAKTGQCLHDFLVVVYAKDINGLNGRGLIFDFLVFVHGCLIFKHVKIAIIGVENVIFADKTILKE